MRYVALLKITLTFLLYFVMMEGIQGQSFQDVRCKCVCSNVSSDLISNNIDIEHAYKAKFMFMANVRQEKCNCGEVVLPRLNTALKEKGYEMCLQCKCKHESKYIGTIKLIALIVIWISSLLVTYMAFMIILNPLFIKKIQAGNNQDDTNDAASVSDDIITAIRRNPLLHPIVYLKYDDNDEDDDNDESDE